jgi:hypothetical protein
MKSRILAVALACGVLAVPAVALASSGGGTAPSTTPVQQQDEQRPQAPEGGREGQPQRPDGHDCPEPGDRGPGDAAPEGEAPEGGSGDTLL